MSKREELQRRLAALRGFRVRVRKQIEAVKKGQRFGGDVYDARNAIFSLEGALRSTEDEWERLHLLLGKDPYPPVVRVLPARRVSA